jgi:cytochrome c-type biogenesis protein CcmH
MVNMRKSFRLLSSVVLMICLSALASVASAQDGAQPTPLPDTQARAVTQDEVNAVARQMYCPVCENEPLDVCRTAACQQWRAQIAQMLSEGQTEQQIKQYFVDRYGLRVLAQPPAEGNSLLLWALPIVALILGGVYVTLLLRRMRARGAAATLKPPRPTDDEYLARVERDLKNW